MIYIFVIKRVILVQKRKKSSFLLDQEYQTKLKNWETLRLGKIEKNFNILTETLNSIQCQCRKLKHWKPAQCQFQCWFFQCFNVSLNVQCRFVDP